MDNMECEICLDQYNEEERLPRMLSCGHSLCQACLTDTIANGRLTCPFCRKGYTVNVAKDVPINFALVKIVRIVTNGNQATNAAVEPELHAGVCAEHGSFKLFWCDRCSVWLCRDCTVIEHPSGSCKVISAKKAMTKLKRDEEKLVKDMEKSKNSHIQVLNNYSLKLNDFVGNVEEQVRSSKRSFEMMIKGQGGVQSVVQNEIQKMDSHLSEGREVWEKMTESNQVLSEAETVEDLISSRIQSQRDRKSLELWIKASQSEVEKADALRKSRELHANFRMWGKAAESITRCSIPSTVSPLLHFMERISAETLDISQLRVLAELASVWVLQQDGRAAQVTVCDNRLLLHSLRNVTPPECAVTLPYENITSLTGNADEVFMKIDVDGREQGVFHIKIVGNTNNFLLRCTGKNNNSFLNTSMIKVLDKQSGSKMDRLCGGIGGSRIVSETKISVALKLHKGLVTLAESDSNTCFCIWYKNPSVASQIPQYNQVPGKGRSSNSNLQSNTQVRRTPEMNIAKLGVITKGMDTIEMAANYHDLTKVVISDCGLILQ